MLSRTLVFSFLKYICGSLPLPEGNAIIIKRGHTLSLVDHGYPNKHSNPHDHKINWSKNHPDFEPQENYFDEIPEFKKHRGFYMKKTEIVIDQFENFKSISDFKFSLIHGREIEFQWNGKDYGVFHEGEDDQAFCLGEAYKDDTIQYFKSADALLDAEIEGRRLRDIVTQIKVWFRNL